MQEPGRQAYRNRCSCLIRAAFLGRHMRRIKHGRFFPIGNSLFCQGVTILQKCLASKASVAGKDSGAWGGIASGKRPCLAQHALGNRISQFERERSITLFWNRHSHVPRRYPPCQYLSCASHGVCQSRGSTPRPVTIKNMGKIVYCHISAAPLRLHLVKPGTAPQA